MNNIVIETMTAVISLQQQTGLVGCFIREPPNPLTIVKCVELALDAESFSFVLLLAVVIDSTVIVISRFAVVGMALVGALLCNLFKRARLAAVKFVLQNVLCCWVHQYAHSQIIEI